MKKDAMKKKTMSEFLAVQFSNRRAVR